MILNEIVNVTYTEISKDTRQILETFQDILKVLLKFYHSNKYGDKRGQLQSLKDFKELKKETKRFHNYSFMHPIMKQMNLIQNEFKDMFQAKRSARKFDTSELRSHIDQFKRGNWKSAKALKPTIQQFSTAQKKPLEYKFNPFYIENPLIFQTNDFLRQFEKTDIEEAANKDLNKFKYSYVPLNDMVESNFQYLAYMILNLSDKPMTKELSGSEIKSYFDLTITDPEYKKLIKMVKSYLSDNDKSLIPQIVKMMNDFPEIQSANEKSKETIGNLYRGFPDEHYPKIADFIATSKSRHVAKRFAFQIGHLESEDNRRSESGVIETYEVTPDDIILDTTIFGGIFGEQEVIIKGNVKPIKRIHV
jgi:hypothetical protein